MNLKRTKYLIPGLILALLFITALLVLTKPQLTAPPPDTGQPAREAAITITKDGFIPQTLQVQKGTRVVWTNSDDQPHQVASNPHPVHDQPKGLESQPLYKGQTYEYTFHQPGSFGYHDHLQFQTIGTIEVVE